MPAETPKERPSSTKKLPKAAIMVVDDEQMIQEMLEEFLSPEGFDVVLASNVDQALKILEERSVDVLITDLKMPGKSGLDLLKELRTEHPQIAPILMTAFATIDTSIAAMRNGAYDYILKPFKIEDVLLTIERALQKKRLEDENRALRTALTFYDSNEEEISRSLSSEKVLDSTLAVTFKLLQPQAAALYVRNKLGTHFDIRRVRAHPMDKLAEYLGEPKLDAIAKWHETHHPLGAEREAINAFFIKKPSFGPLVVFHSIPLQNQKNLYGFINLYYFTPRPLLSSQQAKLLDILASRAAGAMENALLFEDLEETFRQTIASFARSIEIRDKYTAGHSERVRIFSSMIVESMKLDEPTRNLICDGATVHDIGKLSVDLSTLNSPDRLTPEQIALFRSHPERGKEILEPISIFSNIIPMVYHHHEDFDGGGYPIGLKAEEIPLGARVISVADSYDAMTSDRPYRKAFTHKKALTELLQNAGRQFDPDIVHAFLDIVEERLRDEKIQDILKNLPKPSFV